MASAQELFKLAIMSVPSQRTPGVQITSIGEECASEISMYPDRDRVSIIVEKATSAGLNRNQIERLVEVTNHNMMKPILSSDNRGKTIPVINKNEVFSRLSAGNNESPSTEFKENSFNVPAKFSPGEAAIPNSMPKTASLRKIASVLSAPDMGDYNEDPISLGESPREEFITEKEVPTARAMAKLAEYAAEKKENIQAELEYLDMDYRSTAASFAKVASQYVLTGTPFEDVAAASISYKPEKSTIALLKMAANKCYKRGIFDGDELKTWIDSLDYIRDANPAFDKVASIGLPVSDSMFANDLNGRVRIMNGDSMIIKMLDTVGQIEDRIRKAKLIDEQIPDRQITRTFKNTITNVSDF